MKRFLVVAVAAFIGSSACVPDTTSPPTTTTEATTTIVAPTTTSTTTSTTAAPTTTTTTTTTAPPVVPPPDNHSAATVAGAPVAGDQPTITPDGRYVAFVSAVANIVPGFVPQTSKVAAYRLDRDTGSTVPVSVDPSGGIPNASAGLAPYLSITDDGRYVAYTTAATNILAGATTPNQSYVRDVVSGATTQISQMPGQPVNGGGVSGSISRNGQWALFASSTGFATTPGGAGWYRMNRLTGDLIRVDVFYDAGGNIVTPQCTSCLPSSPSFNGYQVLDDGRVAFNTPAQNLIPGQTTVTSPGQRYIYIVNPETREIVQYARSNTSAPSISRDGTLINYTYGAKTFVYDVTTGVTEIALPTTGGLAPTTTAMGSISANGRYVLVRADNGTQFGDASSLGGLFMRDRQTGAEYRVSRAADGSAATQNNSIQSMHITDDGHIAVFTSAGSDWFAPPVYATYAIITRTPAP